MVVLHYVPLHLCVLLSVELIIYLLGISERRSLSAVVLLSFAYMVAFAVLASDCGYHPGL